MFSTVLDFATRGLYICLSPKQSLLKQSHWSENSHIGFIFFEVFNNLKSQFHGKIQVALPSPSSLLSHYKDLSEDETNVTVFSSM